MQLLREPLSVALLFVPLLLAGSTGSFALYVEWRNSQAICMSYVVSPAYEWETYTAEVENQLVNARAQITSAIGRALSGDSLSAQRDLEEAEAILADLPLLAEDFTTWSSLDRTLAYLDRKGPEIHGIYAEIHVELERSLHPVEVLGRGGHGGALRVEALPRGQAGQVARAPAGVGGPAEDRLVDLVEEALAELD